MFVKEHLAVSDLDADGKLTRDEILAFQKGFLAFYYYYKIKKWGLLFVFQSFHFFSNDGCYVCI